jgi:prepilin-type N-terminal cleavage/methylation domain-containing protein
MLRQGSAVTLIEILVVVVIIGILAALALPNFGRMRERAVDREAMANLKLLQAAEKIYRMEITGFYTSQANPTHTEDLNDELSLDLSRQNWEYSTTVPGGNLDARATRQSPPTGWNRNFRIDEDDPEACCCPITGTGTPCPTNLECAACP